VAADIISVSKTSKVAIADGHFWLR